MFCKICGSQKETISQLIQHCKKRHESEEAAYICPYENCTRIYSQVKSFRTHIKSHEKSPVIIELDQQPPPSENEYSQPLPVTNETSPISEDPEDDSLNSAKKEFEETTFRTEVQLLADESLPRIKSINILKMIHLIYRRPLNELFQLYQTNNLVSLESLPLWNTLLKFEVKTENNIMKELKSRKILVPFLPYVLDSRHTVAYSPLNLVELKKFFHLMYICDLQSMFEKLFALPNLLNEVLHYVEELEGADWIFNVTQTKYWKDIVDKLHLNQNETALPLYVFFDDFEPLNALGSHSGVYKLGGVYVYMPCIPPEAQAKLQFIFLGMLFFSADRSSYGNNRVFTPFIQMLNKLQTDGVPIIHHSYNVVKLIPICLIGDNLGLNSITGFVECFRARFYCRICRCTIDDMEKHVEEKEDMMRNVANYEIDCEKENYSLTGIKEPSVWNELHNFHVVKNISVDIAHDLYEGALNILVTEILKKFIYERKYFSLATFNSRVKKHNFGPIEKNTNMPLITEEMLKKGSIRASATEMLTLFLHFGFIVGSLIVDRDCPEWKVYLLMKQIISIVRQKCVHKNSKYLLTNLIANHHDLFKITFQRQLTPKMHFMTHYPRILSSIGPICALSTLRFESFHTIFKAIIRNNRCRKNIVKSCSFKIQMRLANLFLNFESFKSPVKTYKLIKVSSSKLLKKYRCETSLVEYVQTTKYIQINAATFKTGTVIQIGMQVDETPNFAFITEIILNEKDVLLGCQKLITLGFDNFYHAYVVERDDFLFLKTINWKYTKLSYMFVDSNQRNLVMWE